MSIMVSIVLAALIAGFAAGYGMRSLVSLRRRRRMRRSRFSRPASHRLRLESDHSHVSIVPSDKAGDHYSSPRQGTAAEPWQAS
jgi:hypothetical protein